MVTATAIGATRGRPREAAERDMRHLRDQVAGWPRDERGGVHLIRRFRRQRVGRGGLERCSPLLCRRAFTRRAGTALLCTAPNSPRPPPAKKIATDRLPDRPPRGYDAG